MPTVAFPVRFSMWTRFSTRARLSAGGRWCTGLRIAASLVIACLGLLATLARSEAAPPDEKPAGPESEGPQTLFLPFPFYNENFGAAAGVVYGINHYPERQSRIIATAFGGTAGSGMVFFAGSDLRLPWVDRLFIDPIFSVGYFKDTEAYISGNPRYVGQQAGSNTSNQNDYIKGDGFDNYARARFKYLLPIGDGEDTIIPDYEVYRGILVSGATGGTSLLPWQSGRTYVSVRPFYRNQGISTSDVKNNNFRTNGVNAEIFWDNRDFPDNPSRGQGVRFEVSRDFGAFDSNNAWTALEGEVDQYIDFGKSDWFRQHVLALDFWTAHSPSWNVSPSGEVRNRPPSYTGATLGGLWRLRGYPSQRFSDQSAIYYSAELRLIPDWNPFDYWPWFQKKVGVDWVQFVPFAEAGRVAPDYNVENLHSSLKFSVGFGLRAFAKGFVIRADTAYSDEGFGVQMIIEQPFQF